MKIGFIGQGWIGKNLADSYEKRGFDIVRYSKEAEFASHKDAISRCDIVFIAVPTPTKPDGFDGSILRDVIPLVGKGHVAVVKSTVLPGTTDELQGENPDIFVFHAPEFLREDSVIKDIEKPQRNILGIPAQYFDDSRFQEKARMVMDILPDAPYNNTCTAVEAEITKYAGNNFLYAKVVLVNLFHDIAEHHGARWQQIRENIAADPRIGDSHMEPVHQYAHMGDAKGRGAGGHCFIKDFAAFRNHYEKVLADDAEAIALLRAFEKKNNTLLKESGKDIDLLNGVYGPE